MAKAQVGVVVGSDKDLEIMAEAAKVLDELGVACEMRILSAHRTPDVMTEYGQTAEARGLQVIIAGAGGSAHLPGMLASETHVPVLAVPVKLPHHDHEALWSNIKMPTNIPLATMPENNARNAGLMAVRILALSDTKLAKRYADFVRQLHDGVIKTDQELQAKGWQSYLKK
jgi:5-(carboxyamino)imidazole ribonucleotide mutase